MKNYIIYIVLSVVFMANLSAHELSGTVKAQDNKPIDGVGVYNKTTGGYTYTNVSGYFELDDISTGDRIFFYSLGYKTQELTIQESQLDSTIKVVLEAAAVSLDQVVLVSKVNAMSHFVNVDVKANPVKSSQEILRKIPGLIIGQHAGGGKAEQIFLRGFDIDHGTDIAIDVDGLPVNMVSHAHGQGYADMHFIIPETIDNIDFGKGAYYADKGNFNTAGYVGLKTKKNIDDNMLSVEAGMFNTLRTVGMLKLSEGEFSNAYIASALTLTDGAFDSPQNFNRLNIMARYNYNNQENQDLSLTLSHFQSKWDASGQIPQRAIDQGLIGRFGAIDDTEGGNTSRSNFLVNHTRQLDEHSRVKSKAYISKYDFELFSNFTFFLEDPVNADQIRQKEDRTIIGAETAYEHSIHVGDHDSQLKYEAGIGFRYDDVNDVQLSRTKNRKELLERLAYGNVDETNGYSFINLTYKKNKWTINPGLRLDYFKFDYENLLTETYDSKSQDKLFLGPKLNVLFAASPSVQIFGKTGVGFHSNDTRVVIANDADEILPAAYSFDVGGIFKPTNKIVINAALWNLFLEQEFVYVGDAGIVEPSGKTRRYGVDFGVRYQLTDWLYANGDINYTYARSTEEPAGADYIPLAPDLTSSGGLSFRDLGNLSGGINYRYIKNRPANEDNSIVAEGYFVTDMNINYALNNWTFGVIVENLFDTEWNETQFATESRLFNETNPTEEIHFTPGIPFYLRGKVSVRF
ncbi:carboxypeptidase-like regulatory domain-containing protein [Aurantibacter crassamenti]|uniref:TonB-dependent receptor n=1 Tax=Aurantibacter crassamenti TaxID=1837375 RepID=UPI001939E6F2|nr:TonB-dependent receptor [Aurantibacter crassamenti]MBM1106800.1 carboxypeptidase-like regulatory domain-containing protein [Aurantibacter crassamenti]